MNNFPVESQASDTNWPDPFANIVEPDDDEEDVDIPPFPAIQQTVIQPPLQPKHYHPALKEALANLHFRQSMLRDYQICPQMMLYKWILGFEEDDVWLAAILGTAGHSVIEEMHASRTFNNTYVELTSKFLEACKAAVTNSHAPPRISAKFTTIQAQCESVAPEYVQMLLGYQKDEENQKFHATIAEQSFVLVLKDDFGREMVFTGTIDQGGFYHSGAFALRDIKFRQNTFRPGRIEIKLDLQLSLYAIAMRHGVPSCQDCKPTYSPEGELLYTGPCDSCKKKIGTSAWPQLAPEKVEMIWMRDYLLRKKDECAKYLTSDSGEKEFNPATGRSRKKKNINPKWIDGYKKGDQVGEGRITTQRSQAFLQVHMADLLRVAGMIRDGRFYRKPGDHCNFWCKFSTPCTQALEMEVEDIDVYQINEHMTTLEPFQED
jgi:hypothetical protein